MRRFGPLMVCLLFGLGALYARMFQVQVVQHQVWAREAANLIRSSQILPFHRGTILDAHGRPLAYDEEYYQLELEYRRFRRGQPLGQVAHARSSLEQRAVPLDEAMANIEPWLTELVHLTPNGLVAFGRGEALELAGLTLPATDNPIAERRGRRASDVHYYIAHLLLDRPLDLRNLKRTRGEPSGDLTYLEIAAQLRKQPAEDVATSLFAVARETQQDLLRLARLLGYDPVDPARALYDFVAYLETLRREIEDAVAAELFQSAAHFPAGRIASATLEKRFDLRWIAAELSWDEARLLEWMRSAREPWLSWLNDFSAYRALLETRIQFEDGDTAQRLFSELALLYAGEESKRQSSGADQRATVWRGIEDIAVLSELGALIDVPSAERTIEKAQYTMPFIELRARPVQVLDPWSFLADATNFEAEEFCPQTIWTAGEEDGEMLATPWLSPLTPDEARARWRALDKEGHLASEEALRMVRFVLCGFEKRLADQVDDALVRLAERAIDGSDEPLSFTAARIDDAQKRARHILRDQGSRPALVDADPDYDVVHLVTRYPERFAGFLVETRTRRHRPATDKYGTPYAAQLLGNVRESNLAELLAQRSMQRELRRLQRKKERTKEEDERILALVRDVIHSEEVSGGDGLEGYLDKELRGRNGYIETQGIQELRSSDATALYEPPVDGKQVRLTLDLDLQRAAQETLENPILPGSVRKRDEVWFQNPVGAIALIRPNGDVLAAASIPTRKAEAPPGRDGERGSVVERTLRRHTFEPPGSVLKPFVALYALENLGWDPNETADCARISARGAGWGSLHCHNAGGHGPLDMHGALMRSCNAYFARLGENYSVDQLEEMLAIFGFGRQTGLRSLGKRGGLREDWNNPGTRKLIESELGEPLARLMRQAGNGLSVIEATPLQVARATAGLLTGELPELRLIDAIDDQLLPRSFEPLSFSPENIMLVQSAMYDVVNENGGSAHNKGMGEEDLGFPVAAKTGSADYRAFEPGYGPDSLNGTKSNKVRKHTWIAGWFPADDPAAVLVVYAHDVTETSGYTSAVVAAQFLHTPEVQTFIAKWERRQ